MGVTAIFGGGAMGEALLGGLLRGGWRPDALLVVEKRPDRRAELAARHGVQAVGPRAAAQRASELVLLVKPQDVTALLDDIGEDIGSDAVVISLAAGLTTSFLESLLPDGTSVVRAMPNTPLQVDQGMSAISPGRHCPAADLERAERLLGAVGKVVRVPESSQDAVTAVSGSGPAYVFYLAEAMADAGVLLGLPRATAAELVGQTLLGAATMLLEPGAHPTMLRENVTSPGGTTAAALRELDGHAVKAALLSAMVAARDRSRELAAGG